MYMPSFEITFLSKSRLLHPAPTQKSPGKAQATGSVQTHMNVENSRYFLLREGEFQVTHPSVYTVKWAKGKGQINELEGTLETGFSQFPLWFW